MHRSRTRSARTRGCASYRHDGALLSQLPSGGFSATIEGTLSNGVETAQRAWAAVAYPRRARCDVRRRLTPSAKTPLEHQILPDVRDGETADPHSVAHAHAAERPHRRHRVAAQDGRRH